MCMNGDDPGKMCVCRRNTAWMCMNGDDPGREDVRVYV